MCDGTRFPHFIERFLYQRLRIIPPITHTPETDAPDLIACVQYDPAIAVYGQINVYGVTTKSERHKRSYWTRTADGNGIGGRKAPVPYGS